MSRLIIMFCTYMNISVLGLTFTENHKLTKLNYLLHVVGFDFFRGKLVLIATVHLIVLYFIVSSINRLSCVSDDDTTEYIYNI